MLTGWLGTLARRGTTQPIARPVPADDARFLVTKGVAKIAFQVAKRSVLLAMSGQAGRESPRIEAGWKRLLWIHAEAPQIGDALMDLAPRSLFAEHGIAVDLLAPPVLAALFEGDRLFGRVFDDAAAIDPRAYDAVIADSRSWQALAAKRRHAPALPWVSIKGDYLGHDYQRALLATRRLAALLGVALDDAAEQRHARQKLAVDAPAAQGAGPAPTASIAIALGGVRAERTYGHWPEVVAGLAARGLRHVTLLGSANARAERDRVLARLGALAPPAVEVLDLVDRTDLHGARRAMQAARVVLCADGGLMHLALSTGTPVVAVFDASVDPAWRLPGGAVGPAVQVLRATVRDVSAVAPERLVDATFAQLGAAPAPLNAPR